MTTHAAFFEPGAITITLIARWWLPDCLGALATVLTGVRMGRRAEVT